MTNSAFKTFNAYLPYDNTLDALTAAIDRRPGTSLRCFPESADSGPGGGTEGGSAFEELSPSGDSLNFEARVKLAELEMIMSAKNVEGLKEWIQELPESITPVDINRIIHRATYEGCKDFVKYLVKHEGGKLEQKDKLGRSTIFYAVARDDPTMVEYIYDEIDDTKTFREEMNHRDVYKRTPWYYLATSRSIATIEYCLEAGARPNNEVAAQMENECVSDRGMKDSKKKEIQLLLALYTRLTKYLELPVYAESYDDVYRYHALFKLHEWQTDSGLLPDRMEQYSPEKGMTWIHIPWTNAAHKLIQERIQTRGRNDQENKSWERYLESFLQSFRSPSSVIGNPDLNYRDPVHEPCMGQSLKNATFATVVFPCLVLQKMESFITSREFHRERRKSINSDFAKSTIQIARTLDEAYYPSLNQKVLEARNDDQVVSREYSDGSVEPKDRPILMVPQFWIWKFEDHILSAYSALGKNPEPFRPDNYFTYVSHRRGQGAFSFLFNHEEWRSENIGVSTRLYSGHPDLQIGVLLAHLIDNFGKAQANVSQSPLDIFETGVIQVISRVERYMKQPTSLKPDDIKKEWNFMHDISDIRDELAMVDAILLQQESILNSVIKNANDHATELQGWDTVVEANPQLNNYRERVKKIDRDAERIEKNIQDQLNLKRTYASVRDTHNGIILSTAVIGFTIVTVIFTPLAFMASLFALPIDGFLKHQSRIGETNVYATNYIGKWFATAEIGTLAVTGLAVGVSLLLLKIFGGPLDDPRDDGKTTVSASKTTESQDDGKMTGSISKSTKSLKLRRFWGQQKNSEKVEDLENSAHQGQS